MNADFSQSIPSYVNMYLFVFLLSIFPVLIYRQFLKYYNLEVRDRKTYHAFDDITITIPYAIALYFFGNYVNTFTPKSIIYIVIFLLVYTIIEHSVPGLHTDLEGILTSSDYSVVITKYVLFLIILLGVVLHLYLGYQSYYYYIPAGVLSIFLFFIIPLIIGYSSTENVRVHLHHIYIAYILAFFTRFDHPISKICANILLALYIQSIAAYGYYGGTFDV